MSLDLSQLGEVLGESTGDDNLEWEQEVALPVLDVSVHQEIVCRDFTQL